MSLPETFAKHFRPSRQNNSRSAGGGAAITVPSGVGVKLTGGAEGVGELTAPGFVKSDGALVNSAWAGSGPKIELDLTRGVGEIKVTSVD